MRIWDVIFLVGMIHQFVIGQDKLFPVCCRRLIYWRRKLKPKKKGEEVVSGNLHFHDCFSMQDSLIWKDLRKLWIVDF